MAAHDHVANAEDQRRELHRRSRGHPRFGAEGGHDVADVSSHEQVPRICGREKVRHHPAVGAGDEETVGRLSQSKVGEALSVAGAHPLVEIADAVEELLHARVPNRL